MQDAVSEWPTAARRPAPWRLSRSVIDSACPAGTEFARRCRLGRGGVGGSITRGVARDFQFCTATLVVHRSGSGATFVGAVTGLEQQRNGQWR